ncbi:hypothetical protein KIN20_004934, partial [Parelaphostrongylus tenuis]
MFVDGCLWVKGRCEPPMKTSGQYRPLDTTVASNRHTNYANLVAENPVRFPLIAITGIALAVACHRA